MSKVCGNCADYCSNCGDPTCMETGQPVGYLWVRECWKEKAAAGLGQAVADEILEQVSRGIRTPRGRRPQYPPVVDPETGQVVSKRCRICGEYKPIDEFYKNHTHKDGHGDECKPCHNQETMEAGRRRRAAKKAEKPSTPPKEEGEFGLFQEGAREEGSGARSGQVHRHRACRRAEQERMGCVTRDVS